jgi:hypothetical protein
MTVNPGFQPPLADPRSLFRPAPQSPLLTGLPLPPPPQTPVASFTRVSDLLQLQSSSLPSGRRAVLQPLFPAPAASGNAVTQRLQRAVQVGLQEWRSGVRESSRNSSTRIDTYARNARFDPGYEWCGFFAAFAHTQAGFKYPEHYASYQKSRDFFMYRSYTDRSQRKNSELDQLRTKHQAQGSTRQYFMLQESPNRDYVRQQGSVFRHYNPDSNSFNWQNLPVAPGDIVLFHHGHVGLVVDYDRTSGKLTTVEGNTSGTGPDGKHWTQALVRKEYNLSQASDRKRFDGFGRPALDDFKA